MSTDSKSRYQNDRLFEDDVRRVAEAVFQLPPGECKPELYHKGKKTIEIDGIARGRDFIHLLMATRSTSLKKVMEDVDKLDVVESLEKERGNISKKWMIVEAPPEAMNVNYAKSHLVSLMTLSQFQDRFFNGREYLSKRSNQPFGSARDPDRKDRLISRDAFYIEPPMINMKSDKVISLDEIIRRILEKKEIVVLLGPFGAGKSFTLFEIWERFKNDYLQGNLSTVPTALNLRDYWGLKDAHEVFNRHSQSIGFSSGPDLVAAWRAGKLILLLDGFDEVASMGDINLHDKNVLKQIRMDALAATRSILSNAPESLGALITGRDHYFDDEKELVASLGLKSRRVVRVLIQEFDEERAKKYLIRKGKDIDLPDWLPRRALLLNYLLKDNLIDRVFEVDSTQGQALAWTQFLDFICQREVDHESSAIDSTMVQLVLENLSLQVRNSPSGDGPISATILSEAYRYSSGIMPTDAVIMHLQRLPGLTERSSDPGTRSFLDHDLLETLQGSAIASITINIDMDQKEPRSKIASVPDPKNWIGPLGSLACAVAVIKFKGNGWNLAKLISFIQEDIRRSRQTQLHADLLQIAITWAIIEGQEKLNFSKGVKLESIHLRLIDIDDLGIGELTLNDCIIDELIVGPFASDSKIIFIDCFINQIYGIASIMNLPKTITFNKATEDAVGKYQVLNTTSAIVGLDIPNQIKALLCILKKLFRQRGAGRVVGAFHRGIPHDIDRYVDDVLCLLEAEKFAWKRGNIYHPVRSKSNRAMNILDNIKSCNDEIIEKVKRL